ncbi:hypothetical protein Tco_0789088, partial [Tanacetum coccineum]
MHLKSHSSSIRTPIPICYDDDDDDDEEYTIAITPDLSTKGPDNSLSMGDEHLDTILKTESDKVIKSSIEDLDFSDSNDDSTSIDDDSFSIDNIDYVEASPPHYELIEALKDNPTPSSNFVTKSPSTSPNSFLGETNISYNSLPESETFCFNLEEKRDFTMDSFETTSELETFKFDIEEKNSGSTTIHVDISLSDLECVYFKSEPDLGDLTSINPGIHVKVSSTTNVNLPFEDDQSPLFAYVVWIFLSFLSYPVAPPYLLSSGNEDTIFDIGISIYHSFMLGVSYWSETFMKFNDCPGCLKPPVLAVFVRRSLELHILSFILGI